MCVCLILAGDEPCSPQLGFKCDRGFTCLYIQETCNQQCDCEDCSDNTFANCGSKCSHTICCLYSAKK